MSRQRQGSALGAVTRYVIPKWLLQATVNNLHETGDERHEAFVLWGGVVDESGTEVTITHAMRPAQTATRTEHGLLVVVDGDGLFEANKFFYQRGELMVGQVHTHPTDAYHSDTDDAHPLVTMIGALSLVVPDFGRRGLSDLDRWAWYRLRAQGIFDRLDPARHIAIS